MGIRVNCPGCGHKMNIKSFLAGKRGVCPKCKAKFSIPAEGDGEAGGETVATASGQPPNPASGSSGAPVQPAAGAAPVSSTPEQPAAGAPVTPVNPAAGESPAPVSPAPVQPAAVQPGTVQPTAPVQPVGVQPVQPAPVQPAPVQAAGTQGPTSGVPSDPLVDNPNASWYVRPPSGGQFGPARSDVMRQWLEEGRVTSDSLVWCEGWPDWKLASIVFPRFASSAPSQPAAGPDLGAPADDPFPKAEPRHGARRTYYRKKDGSGRIIAITALLFALAILTGLLIWVLYYKP